MKKIILMIGMFVGIVASFIVVKYIKKPTAKAAFTIGILQTASHPALDSSRDGFMQELKNKMGDSVEFIIHNAQGSIAQAHAIAQQFHANKDYKGFFAIATPAAQAISALEKERPIFIAAVTDPLALGFVHPTTNVCGVKDMINVKAEVEMLAQLLPHAKTVGLIYTSGETNSVTLVKQMQEELKAHGLLPVDFAVNNELDMQAMVELACRKVDVLLAPTDNTVASTITLITTVALKNKKPLIVSDNMLVKFGALAARGVDYNASAQQAARIAYTVLIEGKKPAALPIEQTNSEQIFLNNHTLESLGLTIPEILKKNIVLVS
jgi:putative tryptophan/tyrosine transport system substrate-binding protein